METTLRPLVLDDVPAAARLSFDVFADLDRRLGEHVEEHTEEIAARSQRRVRQILSTDPGGVLAAASGGELVGVALSLRRGPTWFLSLLVVRPDLQGQGIGARLLDAALASAGDATGRWLTASTDPTALRRYGRAGFDLHPTLSAKGAVDRAAAPSGLDVRPGSYDDDRALVDAVATAQRGGPLGADLDHFARVPCSLQVTDGPAGRGYVLVSKGYVVQLGATTEDAARRLLWAGLLATEGDEAELEWLGAQQQWAVQVALDAGLALRGGGPVCRQGELGPMTTYLPSGAFG